MQTTSATWKELLETENVLRESKAIINGVEYTDISAPVITRALMLEGVSVGNVVSASCVFSVQTDDIIPKSAEIQILMRLIDGTMEDPVTSEWLPVGTFFVSKRSKDPIDGIITLECYDALLKANAVLTDVPWTTDTGEIMRDDNGEIIFFSASLPYAMDSMTQDIATLLGVEIDSRTHIETGEIYQVSDLASGATIRDALSQIAAAHGGNWCITPDNKLRLVPLVDAAAIEDAVTVEAVVNGVAVGDTVQITGVRNTVGDALPVIIGSDEGFVLNTTLPYALANALYEFANGMTYRPYTLAGAFYDPAIELGDSIRYSELVESVLYSEMVSLGAACSGDIAAPDPAEVTDEFPYIGASQRALTEAKAYTVEAVEAATTALDESLNQESIFNRLTNNGLEQGVLLYDGKIYINATYINTGYLNADVIKAKSIGGTKIADGSIAANNVAAGAITAEKIAAGAITANMITTGDMSAERIKGGTLSLGGSENVNGSLQIVASDGVTQIGKWDYNGISVTSGSITANTIQGGTLKIGGTNDAVLVLQSGSTQIGKWDYDGVLIGETGNEKDYVKLYSSISGIGSRVPFYAKSYGKGFITHAGNYNEMYINDGAFIATSPSYDKAKVSMTITGFRCFDGASSTELTTSGGLLCGNAEIRGTASFVNGNVTIGEFGNIECTSITASGTKPRVVTTAQYAKRLLYCYETPTPMFGDIGEGVISEDGLCYVWLDPVFAQTVTTDQYQVFIQRYSEGECYVSERRGGCFIVKGTPGMAFGWEVKAKQRDFDQLRLDKKEEKFTVPTQTYGADAAQHIQDIQKEREYAA